MATNLKLQNTNKKLFNIEIKDVNIYSHDYILRNDGTKVLLRNHPEIMAKYNIKNPPFYIQLDCEILDAKSLNIKKKTFKTNPIELNHKISKKSGYIPDFVIILQSIGYNIEKLPTLDVDALLIGKTCKNLILGGNDDIGWWIAFREMREEKGYKPQNKKEETNDFEDFLNDNEKIVSPYDKDDEEEKIRKEILSNDNENEEFF